MTGMLPCGLSVDRGRSEDDRFKGLLDDDTARDLRRSLHRSLEGAGYTAPQIGQVTGWPGRTVRRDLQAPEAPPRRDRDRRDDPRRPSPSPIRTGEGPPGPRSNPGRLTAREVGELTAEYGASPDPEVRGFLASLAAGPG
jgi:hypothetical protein